MCGIFGTYLDRTESIERGLERLHHRGPDGTGVAEAGPARHGHVRLALLDLTTASAQPFRYQGELLSFTGEIWNYRELRAELATLGHTFSTTGDTEVLAAALSQWGAKALPRLDGMFAFAWSDGQTHFLARDRYGKVPLYVLRKGNAFIWMSERKAHPKGGLAAPLRPGMRLDLATGQVYQWYSLPRIEAEGADVLSLLERGIAKRLVAHAPLCCLVSGGLDSSLVLALAKQRKPDVVAYTAFHDRGAADLKRARQVCKFLGVELREVYIPEPDEDAIRRAVATIEIASKAQVEIALLCLPLAQRIAADGFKACLSGEAADELFGGYGNMCIKAAATDDAGWRNIRLAKLAKMSLGNFVRCNKVFMAYGVECRLPFMERGLVESVLSMSERQCPPGKKLLKDAARGLLPAEVVNRAKETFQGGSGIAEAAGRILANPTRYYNAEVRRVFGSLVSA
jgi:asparagine synthase (glutamine-hydrolysing)